MRLSNDFQINDHSCQIARIERQIRLEEQSIERMQEELQLSDDLNLKERWLAARDRLRDLRLELMKAHQGTS